MTVHVFGIRHHGPGSARSLQAALDELQPDAVLIEGPPDADALIPLAAHAGMEPPVAILIYTPNDTRQAVYYPFAAYSPEFQAMAWAINAGVHVAFMDLPQTHQMAFALEEQMRVLAEAEQQDTITVIPPDQVDDSPPESEGVESETTPPETNLADELANEVRLDPLGWLGKAAGYNDGERWWEHVIEQRRQNLQDVFQAVLEAMTELRLTAGEVVDESEKRREAYMRKTIRKAQKEGYEKIAVVCGAWHGPALIEDSPLYKRPKADNATLRNMPKVKVECTWIPWTHGRLSRESGYGAGIESPGWYHHLWTTEDQVVIRWLTKVSHLLRDEDLDASTAQVIDTVRLVETLTAIRGYALPGLEEMNEAIQATMVFGASAPMELIHERLIVGEMIGEVPPETPMVPLQRDLRDQIKELSKGTTKKIKKSYDDKIKYFKQDSERTDLNLDLREDRDMRKSHLLHRLRILGIEWGTPQRESRRAQGTFHEDWTLQWQPEFEIKLIEQSVWGTTIETAAAAYVIDQAQHAADLPALTELVDAVMNADLPNAFGELMRQLKSKAALAADIGVMMDSLPPLVEVRYNNLREINLDALVTIIDGLITRINISLLNACASLDNDAAEAMYTRLIATHDAIHRHQDDQHRANWQAALTKLTDNRAVHGLIAGRAARLLLDTNTIDTIEASRMMRLAISTAAGITEAAAWVDGFLRGSGSILLYDDELFDVIDQWLMSLTDTAFVAILPLLRRTFSTFTGPERRQIGKLIRRLRSDTSDSPDIQAADTKIDLERADAVLPILHTLLDLKASSNP